VDPNRLCSDPNPGFHVHSDPDQALELNRLRINSITDVDLAKKIKFFLKSKFLPFNNSIFDTEVFFSANFSINVLKD